MLFCGTTDVSRTYLFSIRFNTDFSLNYFAPIRSGKYLSWIFISKLHFIKISGSPYNHLFYWLHINSINPSDPCISESCIKKKINLNFYFHTSLWFPLRPSFIAKRKFHFQTYENKNLSQFSRFIWDRDERG